jgi:hypothetical protein
MSCNRPWRHRWDIEAPTFSRKIGSQIALNLSVLSPGRPLPSGRFLVLISVRGWIDSKTIVWLEGLGQLKNRMTWSGIETAFSIVLQTHYATACLIYNLCCSQNINTVIKSGTMFWAGHVARVGTIKVWSKRVKEKYRLRNVPISGKIILFFMECILLFVVVFDAK